MRASPRAERLTDVLRALGRLVAFAVGVACGVAPLAVLLGVLADRVTY